MWKGSPGFLIVTRTMYRNNEWFQLSAVNDQEHNVYNFPPSSHRLKFSSLGKLMNIIETNALLISFNNSFL